MRLLAGRALRLSVALAGMLTAAGAFAHAHLQQQIPTAGAQLSASPQTLTLSFSEGIEPAFSGVTVTGPQQHAVATGKLTRSADNPAEVTLPLAEALPPGEYTVAWHVVSVDGHKTKGQYTFISLMLAFGCVLYGAWWAPVPLRRVLMLRFYPLLRPLLLIGAISTLALYLLQGGMMGEGWTDVWRPAVWQAVAGTRFGGVWIWQILLTWIALAVVWIRPRHGARQLVALLAAQLLLSAGVGHAAMHDGLTGVLQRTNHAVHLFCVASWFGGLLPFIYCLRLAQGRWRPAAVYTMARFSRYGHLAVAGTIASGALNALLIQGGLIGASPWGRMLLIKCALVAGMVVIALVNRYVLVPRMSASGSQAESLILRTTQAEIGLGALALLAVSLFATWEPY